MNIKRFLSAFALMLFIFIGFAGAIKIAAYPQMPWKITLLGIFAVSLVVSIVLCIVGARNGKKYPTAPSESSESLTTTKQFIIRLLCFSAAVFVVAILLARLADNQRDIADIATTAAYGTAWAFVWGLVYRLLEILFARQH